MKKTVSFILLIGLFQYLQSQNLVPNSSFENYNAQPDTVNGGCFLVTGGFAPVLNQMPPWDAPSTGSPDPFNICSHSISSASVPLNVSGYQPPHSGNGYAAECTFLYHLSHNVYREYIQVQLDSPLVAQEHYCSSFYVNLSDSSNWASNNFGMYFSNNHIYVPSDNSLNLIPQINQTNIITDTANWTLIYGEYIAQGGERYIIIGNFYNDSLTDTALLNHSSWDNSAYYFIDDVNVHCCTCDSTTSIHVGAGEIKKEEELTLMPNPSNGEFSISTTKKMQNIKIRDVLGREVLSLQPNETTAIIDISPQPTGVYFAEVYFDASASSAQAKLNNQGVVRRKVVKQ